MAEKEILEQEAVSTTEETSAAADEKKSAKAKKEKKKEGKFSKGWKGFWSEVKKITWPSWHQVLKNSGVVLVVIAICAVILIALDLAFGQGIVALTDLFTA